MNAGEIVGQVYENTGYTADDGLVTPAVVWNGVNRANKAIAGERDWPWLETSAAITTVVGTWTYALPDEYVKSRRIVDPDGDPIERADTRQLEETFGEDTGRPEAWSVDSGLVVLRPIPNAVLVFTHFYVQGEPVLSSDEQSPILPAQWHDALVQLAEAHVHRAGRAPERAEVAQDAYDNFWRQRMVDDARRTRGPARPRIRDGSAF